jgi:hypothetical protein
MKQETISILTYYKVWLISMQFSTYKQVAQTSLVIRDCDLCIMLHF